MTLLWVITISWGYYFHDFLENKQISIYTNNLQTTIQKLDNAVKSSDIYDYSAKINNGYIVISQNNSGVEKPLEYQEINNQWILSISWWEESDILYYTLYKNNKKIAEENIIATQEIIIDLDNNYKISAQLNNTNINSYEIYHFDDYQWVEIYNILDKNNNSLNWLKIENYWGKKYYKNSSNNDTVDNPVEIIFDLHGYEKTLILE